MELAGAIVALLGSIFLFLGALGLLRMPDIFNRMQAGTKASTLGTILFLAGITLGQQDGAIVGKLIILILFILFTNPLSSHALARAAHHIGIPLADKTVKDDLSDDIIEDEDQQMEGEEK